MEKQEASKRSQILCIIQVIVEYLANILGVVKLTLASVHWADKTTATKS